jgi:hypothetical protein
VNNFFTATGSGSGTVSTHVVLTDDGTYRITDMAYSLEAEPITSEVPEPSTILMLATGIAFLLPQSRSVLTSHP